MQLLFQLIETGIYLAILYGVVMLFAKLINKLRIENYKSSKYYQETKKEFDEVYNDIGTLGEFYTFDKLGKIKGYKKLISNCYVPKDNGTTTEIDLIMIHETGIYVFESKNYSGWIFGSEKNQYWTQSLPIGNGQIEKRKFFNPVIQNKVHIKWLSNLLTEYANIPIYSYIIFSRRCTLKKIEIESSNIFVMNRDILPNVLKNKLNILPKILTNQEIDNIYEILKPLTIVDNETKKKHIETIKSKN